ncbi:MAG TPA: hypothetical protein VGA61_10480 [Anaerolineae bacterium]
MSAASLVLLAGLVSSFSVGQTAARAAGTGPADALPVPAGTQNLAAGQSIWYAFQYAGDMSQALVRLTADSGSPVNFAVWSPTDVDNWARGGAATPSGRGSTSTVYGGDLIWAGSSRFPGSWYVVVANPATAAASFTLTVSGSGVTTSLPATVKPAATYGLPLPASAAIGTPPPASATPIPRAASSAAASVGGQGYHPYAATPTRPAQQPAEAMAVSSDRQTLAPGQHLWYAFQYLGDKSQILVDFQASPAGSIAFDVWSPGQIRLWGLRWDVDPDGSGAANPNMGGDLIWTGWSKVPGTWYVEVKQTGATAGSFAIQITGSGVSLDLPPAPVPTPTYRLPLPAPYLAGG